MRKLDQIAVGNRRLLRETTIYALRHLACTDWHVVHAEIAMQIERLTLHPELTPPLVAQQLLVSGEDHRHAWHPGFDPIAICRALWRRLTCQSREGASTIEQQIVRTITGRYERTLRRKFKEILLATLIDMSFQKSILPAVYLSIAYYGWRMNGYQQACQRLGLIPRFLSLNEAATLVARLKYPEPKVAGTSRMGQIQRRVQHLVYLHCHHVHDGTYEHLNGPAISGRSTTLRTAHSVP